MPMNTEPIILNFDNFDLDTHVRVQVADDGEPLFVAKDVCGALGIADHKQAISTLDDDELVSLKVISSGQNRALKAVTEGGLYALIFKSVKPEAKKFRRWVTGEVLPAIRRHGRYDPAELARQLPPRARRALLEDRIDTLHREIIALRNQADLALVIPGQLTVWQWLLLQGEEVTSGGFVGSLSGKCYRLCAARGIETGEAKVIDHCGQIVRLTRTARTYPEDILAEVCGRAA